VRRNYYYFVASLQDLNLNINKLNVGSLVFKEEAKTELHPEDFGLLQHLYLPIDNKNLLNLIEKNNKPFDDKGNFTIAQLEEGIKVTANDLPDYMGKFIETYNSKTSACSTMSNENQLTTLFYDFVTHSKNDFIKNWFVFQRNLTNLTIALNCQKFKITNYKNQIIGFDEISETIRSSHARDFGLAGEIYYMEPLLNIMKNDNVQEREKAIDNLRWHHLSEMTEFEYFTVERVMAFAIKLEMVERWLSLDKEFGVQKFKELLGELKTSYELPQSFTD